MDEKERKKFDAQIAADVDNINGWRLEDFGDDLEVGDVPDWFYDDDSETINLKNAQLA